MTIPLLRGLTHPLQAYIWANPRQGIEGKLHIDFNCVVILDLIGTGIGRGMMIMTEIIIVSFKSFLSLPSVLNFRSALKTDHLDFPCG